MKIYLDTSVYSGYYDQVHEYHTRLLFKLINTNDLEVITSQFVHEELKNAKDLRKRNSIGLLRSYTIRTPTDSQNKKINQLVNAYLDAGVLTENSILDATHVAFATLLNVTAIVSNNMRHMVKRQDKFNAVNLRLLDKTVNIYTPEYILKVYEYDKQ